MLGERRLFTEGYRKMKLKAVSGITLILLFIGMLILAFNIQPVKAEPGTWTVDDDGPADFHTIQEAIDKANPGDSIYIYNGIYFENLVISKPVYLTGENKSNTIVDGNRTGVVVYVSSDNVAIYNLTVQHGNTSGIYLENCINSTIKRNTVENNNVGIRLENSNGNRIVENKISENFVGIQLLNSTGNFVYHNTFYNNTSQAQIHGIKYANTWDNGYPSGGNLWDDKNFTDYYHGPYQNETGGDGIGDSPYVIDENNVDEYPIAGHGMSVEHIKVSLPPGGYALRYTIVTNPEEHENHFYMFAGGTVAQFVTFEPEEFDLPPGPGLWSPAPRPYKTVKIHINVPENATEGLYEGSYNSMSCYGGFCIVIGAPLTVRVYYYDIFVSSQDIVFSKIQPREGQVIEINATVHNNGPRNATDILVQFYDGDPLTGGLQIGENQTISEIPAGGNRTVNVSWNTTRLAGEHEIYVTVDPYDVIFEASESNNKAKKGITVERTRAHLTVKTNPEGITTIPGEGCYDNGTYVNLTAPTNISVLAGVQYEFDYWDIDGVSVSGNPITVHMDTNHTATAHYILQYYLTVISPYGTPDGEGWYDNSTFANASLDTGTVNHGNGTRRVFTHWSGDSSGTNFTQSNAIHMDGPKTATANWKTQYLLTVRTDPTGLNPQPTRSPAGETGLGGWWYDSTTPVQLTAQPVTNYDFINWDVDTTTVSGNPITVSMDGPHVATAHYQTVAPPTPPSVGGKAVPINMPTIKPELQISWIWLTTVILSLVLTIAYVKKRKRRISS